VTAATVSSTTTATRPSRISDFVPHLVRFRAPHSGTSTRRRGCRARAFEAVIMCGAGGARPAANAGPARPLQYSQRGSQRRCRLREGKSPDLC
jgi:hypothetical protein